MTDSPTGAAVGWQARLPSNTYAANFFWADDNSEIDNMYCEYHLPKVVQLYISEYDKFKGDLPDFAESIRSGRMTHLRTSPEGFFRSETYNQIYRPHG